MVLYRRHIYQVSALSTFDGSLCAYHGCNGKAAGAQITQSQNEEVVTKNNETVLYEAGYRNGYNLNLLTRIYERASLVPAAAVIPALKVYIVIAALPGNESFSVPGGSMVAKLKLKEIDGRAPPGVEPAA
ncbi:tRNA/tmRNA (uracil-C(5))-methyltransferase [Dirofilaria immitis]